MGRATNPLTDLARVPGKYLAAFLPRVRQGLTKSCGRIAWQPEKAFVLKPDRFRRGGRVMENLRVRSWEDYDFWVADVKRGEQSPQNPATNPRITGFSRGGCVRAAWSWWSSFTSSDFRFREFIVCRGFGLLLQSAGVHRRKSLESCRWLRGVSRRWQRLADLPRLAAGRYSCVAALTS
jgi:hypothetical protein